MAVNTPSFFTDKGNYIEFYSLSTRLTFNFLAFLTEFSDNYKSNWSSQEIYGKMDPIYTYKNTVRTINLGFDVPSYDETDSVQNAIKAEQLIQSLYPVYERDPREGKGVALISSPPLFRIKFSNLITKVVSSKGEAIPEDSAQSSGLLGWIDGFNFKPDLDAGFFIKTGNSYFTTPKLYKVSFMFNVIHEHALGQLVTDVARGRTGITRRVLNAGSSPFSHQFETKNFDNSADIGGALLTDLSSNPATSADAALAEAAGDSVTTPGRLPRPVRMQTNRTAPSNTPPPASSDAASPTVEEDEA